MSVDDKTSYKEAHDEAVAKGMPYYKDPITGNYVITEPTHKARGFCCGSGCRHCPYNHENVPGNKKED
jgi:hypothetical protein